jgi:metal-responsive CopG/Arc/MetJ family transcriptional regulator
MKAVIHIPDDLFQSAQKVAQRLKISRNELFSRAVRAYIGKLEPTDITRKLNDIYSKNDSKLDPPLYKAQLYILEPW